MNPIKRLKLLQRIVRRKIRFQYQVCIIHIKGNEPVKLYSFLVFIGGLYILQEKHLTVITMNEKICVCAYIIFCTNGMIVTGTRTISLV